jgi:hypothetical protein
MNQEPERGELLPLTTIRTESALSRFPIHRLASRGSVNIEIRETNDGGELKTKWKVSYNSEYGQPGALAYKVDTLAINRKFDEIGRPLPALIRLDSVTAIAKELGSNQVEVKRALYQNAFAAITAKMSYKGKDGAEKSIEAGFTRYSIIFTGETLPDGRKADAVYLLLNEIYRDIRGCQKDCVNGNNQFTLFRERNNDADYTRTLRRTTQGLRVTRRYVWQRWTFAAAHQSRP